MNNLLASPTGNRRDFIKTTGSATAASVLAGVALPHVHAAVDDTTQVAVVGAGGRGTGAADNALSVPDNIARNRLVAMADVSTANMDNSYKALKRRHKEKVDVPADRRYIGFDGYAKAMDHL
ncbi:MAG: twin-arginine translocation signal domain-containing protein, partial [Verrucomicrobiota bacterium]|nr:twin-arginine translocation signal domain-containing protein [Verrucomicrobiota bacterium]